MGRPRRTSDSLPLNDPWFEEAEGREPEIDPSKPIVIIDNPPRERKERTGMPKLLTAR